MCMTDLKLLEGMKFSCLEGCGFCCSYPAEMKEYEASFSHIRRADPDALKNGKQMTLLLVTCSQRNNTTT